MTYQFEKNIIKLSTPGFNENSIISENFFNYNSEYSQNFKSILKEWQPLYEIKSSESLGKCICNRNIKNRYICHNYKTNRYIELGGTCVKKLFGEKKVTKELDIAISKIIKSIENKPRYENIDDLEKYSDKIKANLVETIESYIKKELENYEPNIDMILEDISYINDKYGIYLKDTTEKLIELKNEKEKKEKREKEKDIIKRKDELLKKREDDKRRSEEKKKKKEEYMIKRKEEENKILEEKIKKFEEEKKEEKRKNEDKMECKCGLQKNKICSCKKPEFIFNPFENKLFNNICKFCYKYKCAC